MSNVTTWLNSLKENGVRADNNVETNKTTLSLNFLAVPDSDTIVITVSVLEDYERRIAITKGEFKNVMDTIEYALLDVYDDCKNNKDVLQEHFVEHKKVTADWTSKINCHRVLFIPNTQLYASIATIFKPNNVDFIKQNGIKEISVVVSIGNCVFRTTVE